MAKADYSKWITKQDAAEAIGVSTKQIERWAQDKEIQVVKWKRPEGGTRIVVCHPGDVERIARNRNPETETFVIPKDQAPVPNGDLPARQLSADRLVQILAGALGTSQTSQTRLTGLWLTLQEAQEYSGLPVAILRVLIETGRLAAIDVGVRRGGRWRVRKIDLRRIDPASFQGGGNVPGNLDQDQAVSLLPHIESRLLKP